MLFPELSKIIKKKKKNYKAHLGFDKVEILITQKTHNNPRDLKYYEYYSPAYIRVENNFVLSVIP